MQEESAHYRTFFVRSNLLAARLGLSIEDLPRVLGMGRRTVFECRNGDSGVSAMSWAKLKAAEELAEKSEGIADCYGNPNIGGAEKCGESKGSLVMEDERPYRVAGREPTLAEAMAKLGEAVELLRVIVARGEEKND